MDDLQPKVPKDLFPGVDFLNPVMMFCSGKQNALTWCRPSRCQTQLKENLKIEQLRWNVAKIPKVSMTMH